MLVLGTHGRRGVRRMLLGSDAEQIARTATAPVLLVCGERDTKAPGRSMTPSPYHDCFCISLDRDALRVALESGIFCTPGGGYSSVYEDVHDAHVFACDASRKQSVIP